MATTTNYGWETPDDTDLVKDGALAQRTTANSIDSTLGTALNNKLHAGLVLIKTQTIGTAVSSVTVTNAFSATYDNYKIVISGGSVANTDVALNIKFGASSTGYYYAMIYGSFTGATPANAAGNNVTTGIQFVGSADASNGILSNIDVISPYLTKFTGVHGPYLGFGSNAGHLSGVHRVAASYADFTIVSPSNLTGGTIAVYGYAKD